MPGRAVAIKRGRGGKLVSAKSKTGDPQCSQAMSDWKRNGMTAAVAAILGKCRSKAYHLRRASDQRMAGREARAQSIEHKVDRGLTAKERTARARELVAKRREGRATASPKASTPVSRPSLRERPAQRAKSRKELADKVRAVRQGDAEAMGRFGYRRNSYPGRDPVTHRQVAEREGYYRERWGDEPGYGRYVTMSEATAKREAARSVLAREGYRANNNLASDPKGSKRRQALATAIKERRAYHRSPMPGSELSGGKIIWTSRMRDKPSGIEARKRLTGEYEKFRRRPPPVAS